MNNKEIADKRTASLIASCIVAFCLGSAYTWSVFTTPLAARLNEVMGLTGAAALSAGDLSVVFSTYTMMSIAAMIFGGALNDRFGPRWIVFAAGILMGAGYAVCGLSVSVAMLVAAFGILVCLGCASAYSCALNNSIKLFPEKKGLVAGMVTAVYGLSPVVLSPVANSLIASIGVSAAFIAIGIVFGVVIVVCSVFIISAQSSAETAAGPILDAPAKAASAQPVSTSAAPVREVSNDKYWHEMVRDPIFYIMVLILGSGAFFGIMFTSLVSPISIERMGFTAAHAAAMTSLLSLGSACGRLICGYISDKAGRINTITGLLTVACVGLAVLITTSPETPLRYQASVAVLGFCFGAIMSTFPSFCADQFGTRNNSLNYGIMWIGYSAAGAAAPMLTSSVYKAYGSYNSAFIMAIGFSLVGIVMTILYRAANNRNLRKA